MFRGMYTVTSSMQTNQKKLDVVSNNVANANVKGFKKDQVITTAFPEKLLLKYNGLQKGETNFKGDFVFEQDGQGYYVKTSKGYFVVDGSTGKSYSKEMKFTVDKDGYLTTYAREQDGNIDTQGGFKVLDSSGKPVKVANSQGIQVDAAGNVLAGGQKVANLLNRVPQNAIGTINAGTRLESVRTNFTKGSFTQTDKKLDLAIDGEGFFEVQTKDGNKYTRDGSFLSNVSGDLVDQAGNIVMGQKGKINLKNSQGVLGDTIIKEDGKVYVDGKLVDQIKIKNFTNTRALDKVGNSEYKLKNNVDPKEKPFSGQLFVGYVEESNVEPVSEMVEMITLMREYESSQRVIKAYDDMLAKVVNEIPKP